MSFSYQRIKMFSADCEKKMNINNFQICLLLSEEVKKYLPSIVTLFYVMGFLIMLFSGTSTI